MTIDKIVSLLKQEQHETIHKIYSRKLKFCCITARNGKRYKLDHGMDDDLVYYFIKICQLNK